MTKLLPMFAAIGALLSVPADSVLAQSGDFAAEDKAVKQDGRFTARVANRNTATFSNGFVESIELTIQWWGLLGQPVEQYAIRWQMGDSF